MKKLKIILILLCITTLCYAGGDQIRLKEGDIVWIISKSKQSPLIQYATGSAWSHCGIVIEKNDELYVLEASNVVKLTPLYDFYDKGRFGISQSCRVIKQPVKIKYSKYLGQRYDLAFKFNNNRMYCSELVYLIYKEQFGIELCKPRPIKSYITFGLKKVMKKRGMNMNQLVIAPSDLLQYKHYYDTIDYE